MSEDSTMTLSRGLTQVSAHAEHTTATDSSLNTPLCGGISYYSVEARLFLCRKLFQLIKFEKISVFGVTARLVATFVENTVPL